MKVFNLNGLFVSSDLKDKFMTAEETYEIIYQNKRFRKLISNICKFAISENLQLKNLAEKAILLLKQNKPTEIHNKIKNQDLLIRKKKLKEINSETKRIQNILIHLFNILDPIISIDKEGNSWVCYINEHEEFVESVSDDLLDALKKLRGHIKGYYRRNKEHDKL